jgi:predicted ATPase
MWEADIYRLKGELLLAQAGSDAATEAESCFVKAIEVGRSQGARLWELRAAVSLAHLWVGQGKCADAREMLAASYRSFDNKSDIHDVARAAALLKQLE